MAVNWTNSFADREQHKAKSIELVTDVEEGDQQEMRKSHSVEVEVMDFYCTDDNGH